MDEKEVKEFSENLSSCFITCNSGASKPHVKIECENLVIAHEIHRAIIKIIQEY